MTVQNSNQLPLALIIEDDKKLSFLYSKALQEAEFEIEIIEDGHTAINRLSGTPPDVVILDLHLPNVSGDKILFQMRTDKRFDNTRIIIATADAFIAEGLREDSDLVLIKPISINQLHNLALRFHPQKSPV